MEKILSVSIASYNVEKFIRKALDSCCIPEIMDRLEVIVVNDGSTDSTLEIAREYETKYPETFRVIDKINGGYGSTVNASIRVAAGRYFRLLDGDDWFDRDGLVKFIEELSVAEEDMVKVIGKQGRIAKAIRAVVKAATAKNSKPVFVEIQ